MGLLSKLFSRLVPKSKPSKDKNKSKRIHKKQHKQLVKDIKKKAAEAERAKIAAAMKVEQDRASDINKTLDYIQNNKALNSNTKLSSLIELAIQKELGVEDVELTKGNHGLYTIDDDWSGNFNTLINHIKFNKDLEDEDARRALTQVVTSEWGSEEQHDKFIESARSEAYAKNVNNLIPQDMPTYVYNVLEEIMNSSDVWEIVANKHGLGDYEAYTHYESEQAKDEWDELHRDMQKLIQNRYTTASDIAEIRKLIEVDITESEKDTGAGYDKLRNKIEDILNRYK